MPQTKAERLISALDAAFESLRSGRNDGLGRLSDALEAEAATPGDVDATELEVIRRKAQRNAACLEAAARGVRSAQRRLAELRGIEGGGATYDARGRREDGPTPSRRLTQRL
jgi:hypothetical protein